jgi:tetratricopeptide (TPR) repeat protein
LEARKALDAHDAKKALELYNKELEVDSGSELPTRDDADDALLLLDRSMIQQQLLRYEDASRDLQTADKQVEMLDFSRSTADEIGRYLFSDDTGEYKARPFEKLLINTMNIVAYLARGDMGGAKIEARRLAVMQKYLAESQDPAAAMLGPGSYLAGFVFEMSGEVDEALRYYDEALGAANYTTLHEPIRRLAERSSYRSPRITPLLKDKAQSVADDTGELLIVVNHGRVPALKAERIPIGLALTYGAMFMAPPQLVAARRAAGQGLVTWVNFPDLEGPAVAVKPAQVSIDGRGVSVDVSTNVDALVRAAYEKAKGPIVASAITRMITRGAVGAAAGTGVGKGSGSGAAGMLVALVAQAALTAADTPDTRSWSTLPAQISLVRVRVPAGKHNVQAVVQGVRKSQQVNVPKAGWALVNVTELSQR